MGTLQFHLPPDLAGTSFDELARACITGGQDNMPFVTEVSLQPGQLRLQLSGGGKRLCPCTLGGRRRGHADDQHRHAH